jgi:cell division GTPase FtsZ
MVLCSTRFKIIPAGDGGCKILPVMGEEALRKIADAHPIYTIEELLAEMRRINEDAGNLTAASACFEIV